MKNLKAPLKFLLFLVLQFAFTGCVKDIDLSQIDEIQLTPAAVVDLVNFNLEADLTQNYAPGVPVKMEKTVAFEVVTNDLKESVESVDLIFDYFNSLPRTFNGTIFFMTDKNRVKQKIEFVIPPGSKEDPEKFKFTHTFSGEDLRALHQATQVKIEMEMLPGAGTLEGQLQLKSTAAYYFQF